MGDAAVSAGGAGASDDDVTPAARIGNGVPAPDALTCRNAIAEEDRVLGRTIATNDFLFYLTWGIGVVLAGAAWLLVRGRVGRAFRAVRDSEVAAASSGINVGFYKTLAFGISGFYAGVGGSLFVLVSNWFVSPSTFGFDKSLLLVVGAVVGGLGSLAGMALGALFIQFVPGWAANLSHAPEPRQSSSAPRSCW